MPTRLSNLIARSIMLCVIPLVLLAAYVSTVLVFDVNHSSQRRAEQVAANLRIALDNNLRTRIASLQTLTDSADADPLNLPRLYRQSQSYRDHFGGSVVLTDTSLHVLFNTAVPLGQPLPAKLPTPKGFAAAPYAVAHGTPAVGDRVYGPSQRAPLVAVAAPVIRNGEVRRLMLNTVEIRWIQDYVDSMNLPQDWQVSVRDSTGAILAQHPAKAEPLSQYAPRWTSPSEVARWQVVIEIPLLTFYERQIKTGLWTVALLSLALGTSLYLGRVTGRRVFRAVATLSSDQAHDTNDGTIAEIESVRKDLQAERASRTQAEAALRESEQRWRFAIEGSGDGLWDWDMSTNHVFYSSRWKAMLGYADDEIAPDISVWSELVHPDDKQRVLDAVQDHLDGKTAEFVQEYRIRCKDGSIKWMLARGMALHTDGPHGRVRMIGTNSDITMRKEAEERIEFLAYYDPLTGLANRKLLDDRLRQAMLGAQRNQHYCALFFIDLDSFKPVNDLWGHSVGDQMLVQVAQRIKQCLRTGDTVARLGGDEFVIVVQNLGTQREEAAQQASLIAEKVLASFIPPFCMGEHEFHGGASLGVTLFRDETLSLDVLLGQADSAMYRAKGEGGAMVRFFDAELQAALLERSAFEADLRQSIYRNQLSLAYQPQCRLDGSILGAEALLRWQHPELGPVSPSRFIPLAEEDNFIVELGRWVMQQACQALAELARDAATRELMIAVNVSPRQFMQTGFVAEIRDILQQTGADPRRLKLELTESIFARDISDIEYKMNELGAMGISFALDDFGTGYSCLAYLKKLPFDQIKIDQVFVRDLPNETHDAAIVLAVIALSASLGIDVIAEGVETVAQRDFLEHNGCHAFQGYLFGHPVAKAELMQLRASATV
ncbi:MAG: hypothetical protein RL404_2423 [Pseudomonadota bacterium]